MWCLKIGKWWFNINYKLENFVVNGEPTTLSISEAANETFLKESGDYWRCELLDICILGSKCKAPQWVESFNHVSFIKNP